MINIIQTPPVAVKLRQAGDKLPHLSVAGVENVSAVLVYMDSFYVFAVDVAADVIPLFHHQAALPLLCGQIRPTRRRFLRL